MDEIGDGLSLLAILGFVAFMVWHGEKTKQDKRAQKLREREQLLERFGTGEDMTSFLASPEGRKILEQLDDPDSPTTGHGMKMAVIGLVTAGVICGSMGIGFWLVAPVVHEGLLLPAAILGAVGVGCLIAALIYYLFGKAWGMFGTDETPPRKRLE